MKLMELVFKINKVEIFYVSFPFNLRFYGERDLDLDVEYFIPIKTFSALLLMIISPKNWWEMRVKEI